MGNEALRCQLKPGDYVAGIDLGPAFSPVGKMTYLAEAEMALGFRELIVVSSQEHDSEIGDSLDMGGAIFSQDFVARAGYGR